MSQLANGRMSPSIHGNHMVQGTPTRPESRASERGTSPSHDQPFDHLIDYAKINSSRHQANRSDTFSTPSRLERRSNNAKADSRAIHDMFEYGFTKSVQTLGRGIMDEVKAEMRQTLSIIRKDVTSTLANLADTRDTAAGDLLNQVLSQMQELRDQQVVIREQILQHHDPIVTQLDKIQRHVDDIEQQGSEGRLRLGQKVDQRLTETYELMHQEARAARQAHDSESAADMAGMRQEIQKILHQVSTMREMVANTDTSLESLAKEQRAFASQTASDVEKIKSDTETNLTRIIPLIQEQKTELLAEMDFSQVLQEVAKISKSVNADMGTLEEVLGEIGKVQQALFIDFKKKDTTEESNDDPSVAEHGGLVVQQGLRVRDHSVQTEKLHMVNSHVMTDPVNFEKPRKKKVQSRASPSIIKNDTAAMKEKRKPKNVIDGEAMKQKMREALIKGEYNVQDYYHEAGCAQAIAKHWIFEQITFFAIVTNGLWIAVDTDLNEATVLLDADPVFIIMENVYCAFFFFEIMVRYFAFKKKSNCFKDFWFTFDTILVSIMVVETWVLMIVVAATGANTSGSAGFSMLRLVRMVKMFRMARMARLLRKVPELVVLIKTIGVAARSVLFFFLFWLIIIYVFAICFRQLTKESDLGPLYFESVPMAMNTLLLDGLLPQQSVFVNELGRDNPVLWIVIIVFILLASLTVMNMLIGVLVDVVSVVASTEKEKMSVLGVKHDLEDAFEYLGVDHKVPLSKEQFVEILMHPEMLNVISDLGVDPFAVVDSTDSIFADIDKEAKMHHEMVSGLTFEALCEVLLKMRGKNTATVKDMKEQTRTMKTLVAKLDDSIHIMRTQLSSELRKFAKQVQDRMSDEEDSQIDFNDRPSHVLEWPPDLLKIEESGDDE